MVKMLQIPTDAYDKKPNILEIFFSDIYNLSKIK